MSSERSQRVNTNYYRLPAVWLIMCLINSSKNFILTVTAIFMELKMIHFQFNWKNIKSTKGGSFGYLNRAELWVRICSPAGLCCCPVKFVFVYILYMSAPNSSPTSYKLLCCVAFVRVGVRPSSVIHEDSAQALSWYFWIPSSQAIATGQTAVQLKSYFSRAWI